MHELHRLAFFICLLVLNQNGFPFYFKKVTGTSLFYFINDCSFSKLLTNFSTSSFVTGFC